MTTKLYKKSIVLGMIIIVLSTGIVSSINDESKEVNEDTIGFYPISLPLGETNSYGWEKSYHTEKIYDSVSNGLAAEKKNWTWMFYDDADFHGAYDPIDDFTEEACSGKNLNVIVLQDKEHKPAKTWYVNENHCVELLVQLGEVDMGDYQTLKDFVEYSKEFFPADRYFLSLYDHGGGWRGACIDNTNGGLLSMDDMQRALTEAGGVDVVCFTAPCLMGASESVYELRDCTDVYVGSEGLNGYGYWWGTIEKISNMLNKNSDFSNIEIGKQIIQLIEDNTIWPDSLTMSAIRTDKIEALANSLDVVAHDFVDSGDEAYDKILSIYDDTLHFYHKDFLDIYDFVERYSSIETDSVINQHIANVMDCLSESVIAEYHGNAYPNAHGLSIYLPLNNMNPLYADPVYGLDFSGNTYWDEFLIDIAKSSDDPDIDQKQTFSNCDSVSYQLQAFAQTFIPSRDILTRVELEFLKCGYISTDIDVSIRKDKCGTELASASVSSDDIPSDDYKWIEFDFEDIEVVPGESYCIVIETSGGDDTSNYYMLGCSDNPNSYPYGSLWIEIDGWLEVSPGLDACFKTYSGDKAPTVSGLTSGVAKEEYTYELSYIDPNGDNDVYYYIDWGDGSTDEWIGPYDSGGVISVSHTWMKQGAYSLKVKGKNTEDIESDWATLEISLPKNKMIDINSMLSRFLENHPLMFSLLQHLLEVPISGDTNNDLGFDKSILLEISEIQSKTLIFDDIIGDIHVQYWEHVINDVFVKNDSILLHMDIEDGDILNYEKTWRDVDFVLPDSLYGNFKPKNIFWKQPVIFLDEDDCSYFYNFYEQVNYPLICWEVRHTDGSTILYNTDGVSIGYGIPSPSEQGFSISNDCSDEYGDCWLNYRQSADRWFQEWCESTVSIGLPTLEEISSNIQNKNTTFFFELGHSHQLPTRFLVTDGIYYNASQLQNDMNDRQPMKFAFIGSCEGLREIGTGTLSHEFRKGEMFNTVTVGYIGMADCPGWSVSLKWQNHMFQEMDNGLTMKESFDLASAEYPTIASCVRFVGDENLRISNNPPYPPEKPTGPISGESGTEYTFTTSAIDPDEDQVYYMWNWGDGEYSEWLDINESSHTWEQEAKFNISVKAKDIYGAESEWSDSLLLSITKSKALDTPFLRFLDNHPRMFPLLRYLLGN